jgi:hypothetical protein
MEWTKEGFPADWSERRIAGYKRTKYSRDRPAWRTTLWCLVYRVRVLWVQEVLSRFALDCYCMHTRAQHRESLVRGLYHECLLCTCKEFDYGQNSTLMDDPFPWPVLPELLGRIGINPPPGHSRLCFWWNILP